MSIVYTLYKVLPRAASDMRQDVSIRSPSAATRVASRKLPVGAMKLLMGRRTDWQAASQSFCSIWGCRRRASRMGPASRVRCTALRTVPVAPMVANMAEPPPAEKDVSARASRHHLKGAH